MDESNCPLTVKDHVDALLYGSASLGAGLGCQNAYFALRELATALERVHGYAADSFTPSGVMDELIARSLEAKEEEKQAIIDATADAIKN